MALSTCLWNVAKRDENFIEQKTGGWLRYLNVSRRISCTFLLSMLLWKSARVLVRGKQWMLHMHMFIVKHRLFNTLLRPFTRFKKKNTFLKFLCVCSNWPMRTWSCFAVGSRPFRAWKDFFMFNISQGLVKLFFKTLNRDIWLQLTECQIEELSLKWIFFSSCMWCLPWLKSLSIQCTLTSIKARVFIFLYFSPLSNNYSSQITYNVQNQRLSVRKSACMQQYLEICKKHKLKMHRMIACNDSDIKAIKIKWKC